MDVHGESDEVLLAARDAASFERFYRRHVDELLGFLVRRTRDAERAADLTAETVAAALAARRRYRPEKGAAGVWLYEVALEELVLALTDDADAKRFKEEHGVDPRKIGGLLRAILGG